MPVKTNLKAGQLTIVLTAATETYVAVATASVAQISISVGGGDAAA